MSRSWSGWFYRGPGQTLVGLSPLSGWRWPLLPPDSAPTLLSHLSDPMVPWAGNSWEWLTQMITIKNLTYFRLCFWIITFRKQMWSCMSASLLSSSLFQRRCTTSCSSFWICPSTPLPNKVWWALRSSPTWQPVRFTVLKSSEKISALSCCRAWTRAW